MEAFLGFFTAATPIIVGIALIIMGLLLGVRGVYRFATAPGGRR